MGFGGYFPKQTKLKGTKNFKVLFLSLTKCNGNGFSRFATDMHWKQAMCPVLVGTGILSEQRTLK